VTRVKWADVLVFSLSVHVRHTNTLLWHGVWALNLIGGRAEPGFINRIEDAEVLQHITLGESGAEACDVHRV
jgi:hypothetical protein